ncbi:hypothetical protein MJG53_011036 [Ovis ammon polii x Ovis aries]|uniref:Uncharacterized protein n=1 Tax=Ovis ammon polii x Ovis aries TaxID=2918886 RepID=A0ACB9UR88_9CETA|nr:hypothetical protein MJG53_011036 [Ovis ammon polii x Ovis aries]
MKCGLETYGCKEIKLEYEGTLFSEWSVPAACSIKNKRLPKTELRCSSPGIYAIKPIVSGPDLEEERYLYVDRSHICFLWYYKAMKWYISVPMTENDALKETLTFSQNINYETVDDYFKLQYENTGILLVEVRPSELAKTCAVSHKVFQISVGCDASKFIAVKGQRVKYNWDKYGCPLKVNIREKFHPLVQLYNDNGYVEDVEVNFIVWETHGRDDYSFNNTMKKNYKHCFSYAIGKPGDLTQPYEIINKSNHNHLVWPLDHSGIYVFRVKILDPNYSFCNLTTIFAIETFGVIPSFIELNETETNCNSNGCKQQKNNLRAHKD